MKPTRWTAFFLIFPQLILVIILTTFVVGCGSGSKSETSDLIGAAGGTVTSQDSFASVVIPAQSLSQPVKIEIEKASTFPAGVLTDWVYDIKPDNLLFTLPAMLTIKYQEASLPSGANEDELWLGKLSQGQWIRIASSQVNAADNTVTAQLDSFSLYGIGIGELPNTSEQKIDQSGGTLNSDDGLALLDVPSGALESEQTLTITKSETYPSGVITDTVYTFGPNGLVFQSPVTLTIQYAEENLSEGMSEQSLWLAELVDGSWRRIGDSLVDGDANTVTANVNGFSSFGIGGGNELVDVSTTVYIVDNIESDRDDQFTELSETLDYLNTNLQSTETGKIIIQTNRELEIATITLARTILFELEDGFTGKIKGPGSAPLVIDSAVSLGLSGMSFVNTGGLQVNVIGNLSMNNNTLPATTVNYSGLSNNASLNARAISARDDGLVGDTWKATKNQVAGPFTFNTMAGFGLNLDLGENSALAINYNGVAAAGVDVHLYKNLTEKIGLNLSAGANSLIKVDNHTDLENIEAALTMLENSKFQMEVIHSAAAFLNFDGKANAGVSLKSNNIESIEVVASVDTEMDLKDDDSKYDSSKTHLLKGKIDATLTNISTQILYQFDTDANTKAVLNFGAGIDYNGVGNINAKGELTYKFAEDAKVGAFFSIIASGDTVHGTYDKFTSTLGMLLDFKQVSGVIFTKMGAGAVFENSVLDIEIPQAADALIHAENAKFIGGAISIHWDEILAPNKPRPYLRHYPRANGSDSGIIIKDVEFTNPQNGAAGVAISDVSQDVTIENCKFSGSNGFAINIGLLNGNVSIKDNTLNDAGINLTEVHGSINLNTNTISAATATAGLMTSFTDTVNLNGGEITAINSLFPAADSIIQAEGVKLSGIVSIGGGEFLPSRIGFTNTEFSASSQIIDATGRSGGLYNDPMADGNSGLNPDFIDSLIDWNEPHPCADYPPDRNVKDDDGNCNTDGISPPG